MITVRKAVNLRQYETRISLTVKLILVFGSNTKFVREVKNMFPNKFPDDVLHHKKFTFE